MTKEQMIERVEIAYQIYEKLKEIPVNERHSVFGLVEQLNQADWVKFHSEQHPVGVANGNCNTVAPY